MGYEDEDVEGNTEPTTGWDLETLIRMGARGTLNGIMGRAKWAGFAVEAKGTLGSMGSESFPGGVLKLSISMGFVTPSGRGPKISGRIGATGFPCLGRGRSSSSECAYQQNSS